MTKQFYVKLNRAAVREQILKNPAITAQCVKAAKRGAAGASSIIVKPQTRAKNRLGATMMAPAQEEHDNGVLTKAVGRIGL